MATLTCSKNETTCQEVSDFPNLTNIVDKKDSYNARAALYKKPIKKNNVKLELDFDDTPQEIRRQRILHYQKKNRDETVNARRGLLEDIFNSDNEEQMEEEAVEDISLEMEVDKAKRNNHKFYKQYKNLLMMSEWMLEVPQDFTENWIMVPCPVGKRCLVVAYNGVTKVFNKHGKHMKQFKTAFPGGNQKNYYNTCTILDCIWDTEKDHFYILDVLAWSMHEMLYAETEFRFFWVKSQMEELPDIKEIKKGYNDHTFELLPNVPCDTDIYDSLESYSASMNLDGLLFFHKEVHYTRGRTPLVVWLKPYMLPEVLGISVPMPYDEKPSSYIDFEHHVLEVIKKEKEWIEKKQKRNKRRSQPKQEDME